MKVKRFVTCLVTCSLLCSCAEEMLQDNSIAQEVNQQKTFSYDAVTNPVVWKTFTSFEEMMEKCQIPEDIVTTLPTDTLVALCMNHPMAYNYIYYSNPLEGAKIVMERFNGFSELKKRADGVEKVLDFYENLELDYDINVKVANPYAKDRKVMKPLQVGFVELVIASMQLPDLYSNKNIGRLENVCNEKYELKLQKKQYANPVAISKSLIIGAQVKIVKSNDSDTRLKQFVGRGGSLQSIDELGEISRIIYSK